MTSSSWNSPFASWYNRAQSVSQAIIPTFTPSFDTLLLAVLLNAPAENDGFTLALFSRLNEDGPGTRVFAVDALGHVLVVADQDAVGILELAKKALALPPTGGFRNTWVVKRPTTSQPIHRLFIFPDQAGDSPYQISVQGFTKEARTLQRPVQGIDELPEVLWELVGLVLEARQCVSVEAARDEISLGKVRDAVISLF
ncbi:hypothetical protein C0993_000884 [Termitomyces sp. T159_Od127]|nr:hypothetical protein C0993_000884 [Termitomyces sp. T159_Od127]